MPDCYLPHPNPNPKPQAHADTCFAALNLVALWVDGEQLGASSSHLPLEQHEGCRYEEAGAMANAAVAALSATLGEAHPSVLGAMMHVGMVLTASGRTEEAVELLRKVHAAQLEVLNPNPDLNVFFIR